MTIGATIRQLRRERDITQKQLAEALGITSRAVSQWETDSTGHLAAACAGEFL